MKHLIFQSRFLILLLGFLTIGISHAWGDSVTFTGADYKDKGGSSGSGGEASATKNGITITSSKAYYSSDTEIREYTGTIKFSGAKITKIELTSTASGTNNNGPSKIGKNSGESGSYSYSGKIGTWENNEGDEEVVLKCSAQFRWSQIVVTYVSAKPYTVNFYKADGTLLSEKTESSAGAGVTTPVAQSTTCSDWTFAGWTTDNITEETSDKPTKLTAANTTFHPSENCNMYPVFTQKTSELVPLTEILDLTKLSTSPYASNDFTIKWGGSFVVGAAAGSCGFKSNSNMTITMPTDAKLTKVSIHNSNTWGTATVVVYAGTSTSGTNCGSMSSTSSGTDQNVSIQTAQQLAGSYYLANTKSGNAWVDKVTLSYMGYGDIYFKNPICAPTYAITTNNPANGSIKFSTDGTNWSNTIADQEADAGVYFKLVPNAGYEVQQGSVDIMSTEEVLWDLVEGKANTYYMIMPASDVTVSATFSCATPTFKTDLVEQTIEKVQNLDAPTLSVEKNETWATYQWQSSADKSAWENIASATNASYTPSVATVGTTYYRCLLKNGVSPCETFATSNVATVIVNAPSKCEIPTFSLEAKTYTGAQSVELACVTEGAKIYYTTDDTEPSTSSTEYTGAINVFKTMTIRAIAAKDGIESSEEGTATYTIQYTVTFNMQGHGQQVADQKVGYEDLVTDPQTQSITGWTFGGWFKEGACNNQWDFDMDKVTGHTILYAKWTMTKFDVKFYNNGNLVQTYNIQDGQTIGTLPTLTSADAKDAFSKTFVGWTEEEVTTWQDQAPAPITSTKVVEKELTLNAVWAKETEGTGYTNNYQKITSTSDLTSGDYIFMAYEDYYSTDYYWALDKTTYQTNFLTATSVKDKLSDNKEQILNNTDNDIVWTIAFKNNDNSKISIKNGNNYLNMIQYSGHRNLKCSSTSDYFTYSVNNGLWKFVSENQSGYKVYYNADYTEYGTIEEDASVEGQLYLYKRIHNIVLTDYITHSSASPLESITLNTTGVKKNYFVGETFTSANLSATAKLKDGIEFPIEYNDLTISTPDLTSAGETVTVEYTFNGATKSATYKVNAYSVTINMVYTDRVDDEPVTGNTYSWTPTTGALKFSTQAHYQFNGITSEVVGVTLNGQKPNYTLSNPTANVTLTATWQRLFTLTYNGKGGSTPDAVEDEPSGTEITLATPSWTGYDFVGWFDNEGYEGDALTSPYTITADAEIFAKWSEIMPASISLSPDVTEITDLIYDDSNKNTKKITATVNPSTALVKTFEWSVVEGGDFVEVATDGTITAKAAGTAKVKVASTRDANIYKEISVTVHALPQITWLNMDGTQFGETTKGTSAGKVGALPTGTPTSCNETAYPYFRGWSAENFGKTTTNPESSFVTKDTEVALDGEYTFYAVCAAGTNNSEEYSFTIQTSDFNTDSYDANNGSHNFTATATIDASKTMTIACTTNQIYKNGDMQWQKNKGYVYNTTDLGTIKSVVVNSSEGSFTTYYGTSEHPTSGTTVGNGFFTVQVGGATGKTSSIVVTFETGSISYTTWATQCCISPENPLTITPIDPMKKNEEIDLEATGGNGSTIIWSTESNKIELTSAGHVKALGIGEAVVTATQEKNEDVCEQVAQFTIQIVPASMFGVTMSADEGGTAKAYFLGEEVTTAETDDVVTITAEADDDHNFTGWEVLAGEVELGSTSETSTTFTMGSANVQIKAHFAKKQFTITLNAGNGTIEGGSTKELKNQDIHSTITLPDAVACNSDEWEFKGWATSSVEETNIEPTFVSSTDYEVTEDATLYAVYGQTTTVDGDYKYKIYAKLSDTDKRYLIGEPVIHGGQNVNTIEVGSEEQGQVYTFVTIDATTDKYALKYTANEGDKYLFIKKDGSNYYLQSTSSCDNDTRAYWAKSTGTKGSVRLTNVNYTSHGIIYRLEDNTQTYNYVRAFNTSNVTATGKYYDLELQQVGREQKEGGVWNSNPSCKHHYQVTYDGNGTTTTCTSEKWEEGEITLCADEPSLAGYTFAGWNDGTNTYAAGAKYNLTAPVTFTAVWNPIKVTAITLNVTEPQTLNWKSDAAAPTFQLSVASTTPAAVADNSVTWSVSEGSAVSVSEKGLVTAEEAGTATITATANDGSGVTASCTFTVTKTYKLTITDTEGVYNIKANTSTAKNQYHEAAKEITLSGTTKSGYIFGEWVVMQGETPITVTDNKFTMPAADVTVTATFTTKKDYYVDDMNDNAQIVMEGQYTVPGLPDVVTPTSTNSCESTHLYFVGWIETEISSGQTEVPSGLITAGEEKTAGEKTYHAVWAEDSNNNQ